MAVDGFALYPNRSLANPIFPQSLHKIVDKVSVFAFKAYDFRFIFGENYF